jgi:hypothetical protein
LYNVHPLVVVAISHNISKKFTIDSNIIIKMKIAVLLSAIAGVSAFAPASQSATRSVGTELNAADLSSMRGVGPETFGQVVSTTIY